MNLIEQLGGYEAVKQAAVNYKNSGDRVTAAGLELQCLEYRRQHNIYEVGDWVYPVAKGSSFGARQITEKGEILIYSDHLILNMHHWRHATDEEIKAGRRLPVIESDDCSDIRNHISPNTVVIDHAT